jgi:bifunctional non-homologous end joining protein LigD
MIRLTHPDKPLFAAPVGVVKSRLLDYWRRVAPHALPHIVGRPLSLLRCPRGGVRDCFFQRHHRRGMPVGLRPAPLLESDGETAEYLMIEDLSGLESVVQIDTLELHVWGARLDAIERPDRLAFDLDPDVSLGFDAVKSAALDFRDLLDAAGVKSFPLLTGGKGVHVVAPLAGALDWDGLSAFAKGVAKRLSADDPARFTAIMSKSRRAGKIYIDYRRNERGGSAIAPFSPRARERPSVATPVAWSELGRIDRADFYEISSIERRLASLRGDPWEGYFELRQNISAAALRLFAGGGV